MIKFLLPIVQRLRRFYWWLVRPTTRGVRAIVINQNGEVSLVQHTYQVEWFLPGGKNHRNKNYEDAVCRELREELGIRVVSIARKLGEYENSYEYKKDTVVVFVVNSFTEESRKHFEVEKHQFFKPGDLSKKTSPGTHRRIDEWPGKKPVNNQW